MSKMNEKASQAKSGLSRRAFLSGAALAGAGVAAGLVGCAPAASGSSEGGDGSATASAGDGSASGAGAMTAATYFDKWAFEIPDDPITDIAETIEAEIVVVGAGTGGLAVANAAAEEGANVVLISASSKPISRGGSNHATYSKAMKAMNIEPNSAEWYMKELQANGARVDTRKWYKYFNNSEAVMDWLIDIMEERGYSTGIENFIPTVDNESGSIYYVPGAHGWYNDEHPGMGFNQTLVVNELATRFEELSGTKIYYNNIGRQLVRGDQPNGTSGRVTAIIAERADGTYAKYVGTKAVVLATGDFSTNKDMMAKYAPEAAAYVTPEFFDEPVDYDKELVYGGLYPGDGQKMGLWIGAAWQKAWPACPNGGGVKAGPMDGVLPFTGFTVNREGKRFCNEYGMLGTLPFTIQMGCPGGVAYAIWNKAYADDYPLPWVDGSKPYGQAENLQPADVVAGWDEMVENRVYVKADTLEELIGLMELPESTLDEIKTYNEYCAQGDDQDFHKYKGFLIPLEEGPFYGEVSNTSFFLTILGGLRTDDYMRVCDEDDNPIEGLYNVGSMAGDMFYAQYTYMIPGFTYGSNLTLSYMTGKYIAANE
ncbi:FAD-binding protein [uncultured Adlercreutzia sp.]|uniref:FAD-binding protein n=1 Tax=uncultured Adlercreutzia sp. TaxID=875803 RepID=UPI0025DC31F5|nr:FAD-binding protein [uncultured Adlercreutzia sp.]